MKRIGFLMACSALMLVLGCDNRTTPEMDGGGIMLMDSGPEEEDAATDTDSGSTTPRECEMNLPGPFPAALTPRCTAETRTCIEACRGGACVNSCIDADTTPPETVMGTTVTCETCLGYSQAYCIEQNGGADLWHALQCCAEDRGCTNDACVQSMCPAEFNAVFSAANPAAATCLSGLPTTGAYASCFPAG